MRVLGIDPGTRTTGYGIIETSGSRLLPITYGVIQTAARDSLSTCFLNIHRGITDVIMRFHPDVAAVEDIFYCKNVNSAIKLGEARGVAIVAAAQHGLDIYEYTPRKVKQAVVGYGAAEKLQVQKMVKALLGLPAVPEPEDASDALGVAICHAQAMPAAAIMQLKKV
ncbi:MAG TPA: crossover junction endodeoxyribonuclease RuvC [bacterium]|nr:crossover junction endodeoxyribonuclease RuvC [bacterium]